jgi:ATP-dependent DNA ligase
MYSLTKEEMKKCIWLKPELGMVIVQRFKSSRTLPIPLEFREIEFAEWTPDGHLRRSKFVGLRDDKEARSVTREQ